MKNNTETLWMNWRQCCKLFFVSPQSRAVPGLPAAAWRIYCATCGAAGPAPPTLVSSRHTSPERSIQNKVCNVFFSFNNLISSSSSFDISVDGVYCSSGRSKYGRILKKEFDVLRLAWRKSKRYRSLWYTGTRALLVCYALVRSCLNSDAFCLSMKSIGGGEAAHRL